MKTVRHRILEYISAHQTVTTSEISHSFRMSHANARHHLNILKELGSIQVVDHTHSKRKGRPERVYSMADGLSGNNLENLIDALLIMYYPDPPVIPSILPLEKIADRMAQKMNSRFNPVFESKPNPKSLTHPLNSLIEKLNNYSYASRWEAHSDGPRIVLGQCPYRAVIKQHPEICMIDERLISQLLGSPVELIATQVKNPRGQSSCLLRIKRESV